MAKGVKVVDRGLNDLIKRYRGLTKNQEARVGVQGKEARDRGTRLAGGPTNVELFTIHEFGAPKAGIPARSSLRAVADSNEKRYQRMLADEVQTAFKRKSDVRKALLKVGETFRADVISAIKAGIPPPNTPATLARKKGETTPLIDTGSMIGSLSVYVGPRRLKR